MARFQAGFLCCNDIAKEFLRIKICQELSVSPDLDFATTTWRQWCHDKITQIKRYRFWNKQTKEEDDGEEIPTFENIDVTFVGHLLQNIEPDCPAFDKMRNFRNEIAHNPPAEISHDIELDDWFRRMEDIVNELFSTFPDQRLKWRRNLNRIRQDDISLIEPQTKGFYKQITDVRQKEEGIKVDNIQNAQQVVFGGMQQTVFNIHLPAGSDMDPEKIARLSGKFKFCFHGQISTIPFFSLSDRPIFIYVF